MNLSKCFILGVIVVFLKVYSADSDLDGSGKEIRRHLRSGVSPETDGIPLAVSCKTPGIVRHGNDRTVSYAL